MNTSQQLIESPQNALVKIVVGLHQRKARQEQHLILVETKHPIEEALKAGLKPVNYFYTKGISDGLLAQWPDEASAYAVRENVMKKMATTDSTPPCLAVFEMPEVTSQSFAKVFEKTGFLVAIADSLQDPGNLGTLIRSTLAFGADGLILTGESVDAFSPKVIRASAGLVFSCPVLQPNVTLESFLASGDLPECQVIFTTGHQQWHGQSVQSYKQFDFTKTTALVFGNEGKGLPESEMLKNREQYHALRIPISAQVESLNISVSASILLAEAAAQRGLFDD